jgi:hypothetical protein
MTEHFDAFHFFSELRLTLTEELPPITKWQLFQSKIINFHAD